VIAGTVRAMRVARTGIGAIPDSLVDAGAVEGLPVRLVGARDTLYRMTDAQGMFTFLDVTAGPWSLSVPEPADATMRWASPVQEIVVRPGATVELSFTQLPRRREVRLLEDTGSSPLQAPPSNQNPRR
jgi:hypothetical protein